MSPRSMGRLLKRFRQFAALVRCFGFGWLLVRARHAWRARIGSYARAYPTGSWDATPDRPAGPPWMLGQLFSSSTPRPEDRIRLCGWDEAGKAQAEADGLLAGSFRYFSQFDVPLGTAPDWFANPFTGERIPADTHWSRIGDFDHGDIKLIWEPSRFGWAYSLVRAFWRTGDERYVARFWELTGQWLEANPPHRGANWKCGQEVSLRLLAWCFALQGLASATASTDAREAALARAILFSARRIEATLSYALSQRNNHGISEAAALWTVGLLFPDHPRARHWRALGRRQLELQARALIDDDGAFAQQSVNYQRVMLQAYLWAIRLGDVNGQPLSPELRTRVGRAAEWLYRLQDRETGTVPHYGHNDGALILPLTGCDYDDYRPVIQAARCVAYGVRTFEPGPWDEELWWLGGDDALEAPLEAPVPQNLQADCGGYYTLRSPEGFAFLRCGPYRHRPAHADQMHADLWWRGCNIALDAGTYSYNAPAPWDRAFVGVEFHNTVTVDHQQPMERAGRFLWLPWEQARIIEHRESPGRNFHALTGERDGYLRLPDPVRHRRLLMRLGRDAWLILDCLQSWAEHRYRLHWLLADLEHEWDSAQDLLRLKTAGGFYTVRVGASAGGLSALVKADPASPRGWQSAGYLDRRPALSLSLEQNAQSLWFWSLFSPGEIPVHHTASGLHLAAADWTVDVTEPTGSGRAPLGIQATTGYGDALQVSL